MKIINQLKDTFRNVSNWFTRHFGPDRLSILPRKIQTDKEAKKMLRDLRKFFYFSSISNISITGGITSGKKSFIKTFENTRYFPIGKFIHIDIRHFVEEREQTQNLLSFQTDLDRYIDNCITSRAQAGDLPGLNDRLIRGPERLYRKPLIAIMVAFLMGWLLSTMNQWSDLFVGVFPETLNEQTIQLCINICCVATFIMCCISIINSAVALWPLRWINKVKAASKTSTVEFTLGTDTNQSEYTQIIIYALCKMRWQIAHTVVFENLETLGEEDFQKAISHLCSLNHKINEHGNTWKLWDISIYRRPIRFFYIYRDDLVQLKTDKPLFEKEYRMLPNVTVDNVFYELKSMFETEASKGVAIPLDKLFPVDPNYMAHVSKYLVNRRLLNKVVHGYINEYEDFISRTTPSESDLRKLLSFVIYGLFFPKDRAKFAYRTSFLFTDGNNKEDIDPQYGDLFEYLISSSCPEVYRINYLCMRFVGLCPSLLEEHIRNYKQSYENGDYKTAQIFIEKAICCQPDDAQLHTVREELLLLQSNLLTK